MLLYDTDEARSNALINYVNKGLGKGQLIVYASVDFDDDISKSCDVLSKVTDYEQKVNSGDLLVVDLRACYKGALTGDLSVFKDLKTIIEKRIKEKPPSGGNDEITIVSDCADKLSKNEKFDECINVERWWHATHLEWLEHNLKIKVICPHLHSVLDRINEQRISSEHSTTIRAQTQFF